MRGAGRIFAVRIGCQVALEASKNYSVRSSSKTVGQMPLFDDRDNQERQAQLAGVT
jgi:hypothetical protein